MKNKKWYRSLFRRRITIAAIIVLQVLFLIYVVISSSRTSAWISRSLAAFSFLVALYIIGKNDKGAYKLVWVFQILVFPIFGGLFYLLSNFQPTTRNLNKKLTKIAIDTRPLFYLPGSCYDEVVSSSPEHSAQVRYLQKYVGFPIYNNTKTKYLTPGEEKFKCLIEELNKAEKYIFLEYFIIQEGEMWNTILDILKEKAKCGVDVRVMYDDMGCFFLLPSNYVKQLGKFGIKCCIFNPFRPFMTTIQNNRDHRKIASIDGKVVFTGGINLADEYINKINKHGHWKDASVMIEGTAAWSMTVMFLQIWNIYNNTEENYEDFYPWKDKNCTIESDGYVQPYTDSPIDSEHIGEHVYMQMITGAKKYLYITTPYLIIDDSMVSALNLAAKSGIDVRITTPYVGDKWYIQMTTRSYYRELIESGVKIYEYSKGFIHSKTFVSDDQVATVGTINLDFRSLYLNFECGVWLYKTSSIKDMYDDYLSNLEECRLITADDFKCSPLVKILQDLLRMFAPLM